MLTLRQKFELGTKGEWIALVQPVVVQVASEITHEKPWQISFGDIQDAALAQLPEIKAAQQLVAYGLRERLATAVTGSRASMEEAARRAAFMLASAMAEDVEKVDAAAGAAVAGLMTAFLAAETRTLDAQSQAVLDTTILATVREGWSALAGYNVHVRVPAAIVEAANAA